MLGMLATTPLITSSSTTTSTTPSIIRQIVEHGWSMEAFEQLLEAWVVMIEDPGLGIHAEDIGK